MAFMSFHSNDNPKTKINVELIESEADIASEFRGFPVLLTIDGTSVYLRKKEAEDIWVLLGAALQDIDRAEINEALDPKRLMGDS